MKLPKKTLVTLSLCVSVTLLLIFSNVSCKNAADVSATSQLESYLLFPEQLTPVTPYDVDTALVNKLQANKQFAEAQRLFEILSWQMFISLNWPVDAAGKPKPAITDPGKRIWESWKESFEIFKEDGSTPLVWGSAEDFPEKVDAKLHGTNEEDVDVLFRSSKHAALFSKKGKITGKRKLFTDTADEVNQAFTSPIWDQHGNIVRYEIRLNKPTVDYIVKNELYNIDGQIIFSKRNKVSFPSGTKDSAGSIEVKFAWREMDTTADIMDRYFTKAAYVLEKDGAFAKRIVGLVGMHISIKTKSSPQWIWSTFEHVDNLETDQLEKVNGKPVLASFYDPACSTCPINLIPDTTKKLIKNQIQRVLPIPMATQNLNKQVQSVLKAKKSVWQYYQLIGTQWPTDPSFPAYPVPNNPADSAIYKLPDAVVFKASGAPVPTYLTNMVMETYFQGATVVGSTPATTFYNLYLANEPAYYQIQGFPSGVDKKNTLQPIFGTEGCINCHHSAGIATGDTIIAGVRTAWYGPPESGDFEWLLQLKAHFKKLP
ncbi:MAG: hypothetical protein V4722_07515 [Bacteroidota bacterium]